MLLDIVWDTFCIPLNVVESVFVVSCPILSTRPEIVIAGLVVPKSNISGLLLGNAICIGVLEKDNANWSTFNASVCIISQENR